MTTRATELHKQADDQIRALDTLISTAEGSALDLPLRNRGKLGEGTVGAVALLIADNYLRIAAAIGALTTSEQARAGHHIPRWAAHRPPGNRPHESHDDPSIVHERYREPVEAATIIERLTDAHDRLQILAELTDRQLDTVPPRGSTRFADGRRTLAQVIEAMLKHQQTQQATCMRLTSR